MIGTARRRRDGDAKVRGATRYVGDLPVYGLLHARPVLAAEAHARITGIDGAAALAVPGVVAVLTAGDLPEPGGSGRAAEPLAREEIVWAGQPVALVVAESEAAAEDGAALVVVDADPLPAVMDLESALAPGAPAARVTARLGEDEGAAGAHTGPPAGGEERGEAAGGEATGVAAAAGGGEARGEGAAGAPGADGAGGESPNVAVRQQLAAGDVDGGLARADAVVSGRFRTSWVHQAYLEPQSALAWVEPDGELVVQSSTQGAFMVRDGLSKALGLPLDRVRVRTAPLGGAFGGKLMISEPLAAAAALVLKRPVRLVFGRSEDFAAANPAPAELIDLELGATRDGKLTAIRGRIVGDRGGLGDMGVEMISTMLSAGPYNWPAHDLTAVGVATNRVSPGAYRAPGAPPAAFAIESLLDRLATELELDPIELRLSNVMTAGDRGLDGQEIKVFGARECLEAVKGHPLWQRRSGLADGEGIGVALGFWPGGLEPAAAVCKLDADGKLTVVTAAADMSGIENAFIAIAAEAFGLEESSVRVTTGDTAGTPYGGVSGGSKVTYTFGRAVERAAALARERLLAVAATELEIAPEDLELADGEVRVAGAPQLAVKLGEIARILQGAPGYGFPPGVDPGLEATAMHRTDALAYANGCHACEVEVDAEIGEVRILRYVAMQD
ncbi:MAG TPA: xanthine dehydrogenase family protein, partial [Solirubrobacter sp.]|nr:xanthine dehydrogenase family protein [Solirubrobacter sp.]